MRAFLEFKAGVVNLLVRMSVLCSKILSKHVLGKQKSPKSLPKHENNLPAAKCSFPSCSRSTPKNWTHSKMNFLNAPLPQLLQRPNRLLLCFQNLLVNKQLFCKVKLSEVGTVLPKLWVLGARQ